MNVSLIVTIVVLVLLAFLMINGLRRGFLRILLTTFSLVITLVLAAVLLKPVSNFIQNKTSIGIGIEEKVGDFIDEKLAGVKDTKEDEIIDSLPLPSFLKKDLHENNTIAKYKEQGVNSFRDYAVKNITTIAVKAITYLALMIIIFLLLRLLLMLTKFINKVPVIGGINRILGAILGLVEGLIIIWALCLLVMSFSGSEFGATCMKVINNSVVLKFIYDNNLLTLITSSIFKVF